MTGCSSFTATTTTFSSSSSRKQYWLVVLLWINVTIGPCLGMITIPNKMNKNKNSLSSSSSSSSWLIVRGGDGVFGGGVEKATIIATEEDGGDDDNDNNNDDDDDVLDDYIEFLLASAENKVQESDNPILSKIKQGKTNDGDDNDTGTLTKDSDDVVILSNAAQSLEVTQEELSAAIVETQEMTIAQKDDNDDDNDNDSRPQLLVVDDDIAGQEKEEEEGQQIVIEPEEEEVTVDVGRDDENVVMTNDEEQSSSESEEFFLGPSAVEKVELTSDTEEQRQEEEEEEDMDVVALDETNNNNNNNNNNNEDNVVNENETTAATVPFFSGAARTTGRWWTKIKERVTTKIPGKEEMMKNDTLSSSDEIAIEEEEEDRPVMTLETKEQQEKEDNDDDDIRLTLQDALGVDESRPILTLEREEEEEVAVAATIDDEVVESEDVDVDDDNEQGTQVALDASSEIQIERPVLTLEPQEKETLVTTSDPSISVDATTESNVERPILMLERDEQLSATTKIATSSIWQRFIGKRSLPESSSKVESDQETVEEEGEEKEEEETVASSEMMITNNDDDIETKEKSELSKESPNRGSLWAVKHKYNRPWGSLGGIFSKDKKKKNKDSTTEEPEEEESSSEEALELEETSSTQHAETSRDQGDRDYTKIYSKYFDDEGLQESKDELSSEIEESESDDSGPEFSSDPVVKEEGDINLDSLESADAVEETAVEVEDEEAISSSDIEDATTVVVQVGDEEQVFVLNPSQQEDEEEDDITDTEVANEMNAEVIDSSEEEEEDDDDIEVVNEMNAEVTDSSDEEDDNMDVEIEVNAEIDDSSEEDAIEVAEEMNTEATDSSEEEEDKDEESYVADAVAIAESLDDTESSELGDDVIELEDALSMDETDDMKLLPEEFEATEEFEIDIDESSDDEYVLEGNAEANDRTIDIATESAAESEDTVIAALAVESEAEEADPDQESLRSTVDSSDLSESEPSNFILRFLASKGLGLRIVAMIIILFVEWCKVYLIPSVTEIVHWVIRNETPTLFANEKELLRLFGVRGGSDGYSDNVAEEESPLDEPEFGAEETDMDESGDVMIASESENEAGETKESEAGNDNSNQLESGEQADSELPKVDAADDPLPIPRARPNMIYRQLLGYGRLGHSLIMVSVFGVEWVYFYLPTLANILSKVKGKVFKNSGAFRDDMDDQASQAAGFVGTDGSVVRGGRKRKAQTRKDDQKALSQLQQIGDISQARYRFVSESFMRRHEIGRYAGERPEIEIHTFSEKQDAGEESDNDWVLEALTKDESSGARGEKLPLETSVGLSYGSDGPVMSVGVDFNLGGNKRKRKKRPTVTEVARQRSASTKKKKPVGPRMSDRESGVMGRIRAAGANSLVGRSILGAYPGDLPAPDEAADARGLIDLAEKYGYGDWSDDEDDYGKSRRHRRASSSSSRRKSRGHRRSSNQLGISFEFGTSSEKPRTSPARPKAKKSSDSGTKKRIIRKKRRSGHTPTELLNDPSEKKVLGPALDSIKERKSNGGSSILKNRGTGHSPTGLLKDPNDKKVVKPVIDLLDSKDKESD